MDALDRIINKHCATPQEDREIEPYHSRQSKDEVTKQQLDHISQADKEEDNG
jgi:hypothetical protein